MKRIWIHCTVGALLLTTAAVAQPRPQINPNPDVRPVDDAELTSSRNEVFNRLPQTFAGSELTLDRAERIARAAGFELVDFDRCAYSSDDCALFEVIGPAGRVFIYQVSSRACMQVTSGEEIGLPGDASGVRTSPTRSARRGARARRRSATGGGPTGTELPAVGSATEGPARSCFGGFAADYRLRVRNEIYADKMGHSVSLEHDLQLVEDGRWRTMLVTATSAWKLLTSWPGSMTNQGWAYEVRTADSQILFSDGDSFDAIASSEASGLTLKDRCQIHSDNAAATVEAVVETFYAACKVATVSIPDEITVVLDLQFGIGAEITGKKNLDHCATMKGVGAKAGQKTRTAMMDDCVNNPGRYFPSLYPQVDGSIPTDDIVGFEPGFALDETDGPLDCPSTHVFLEVADMGGGIVCAAYVRRTCTEQPDGTCYCTNPVVEGDIICE